MRVLIGITTLLASALVQAYPHYIGHGYTSCKSCHYNPFGGGIVNDYARVVNATSIASGALYPDSWDNEKVAYHSDFLFGAYKPKHVRMQANYRGIQIISNPGSSESESTRWITMQEDLRGLVKFGQSDKFLISGSVSRTPRTTRSSNGQRSEDNYRSREHYVAYRPNQNFGVYAGLLDQVFGIRFVEHNLSSRKFTEVSQNDQTHGVALHYLKGNWEGGTHLFAGNLSQDESLRMKGISTMLERTVGEIHRVGFSVKKSSNEFKDLLAYSAHTRISLKSGSSLQFELGQTKLTPQNDVDPIESRYAVLQTYLRPIRGLYLFTNIDYFKPDTSKDDYTVVWGPGIQYLPIHRTEFRLDLQNIRNFDPEKSVRDTWQLLLQTHFWL